VQQIVSLGADMDSSPGTETSRVLRQLRAASEGGGVRPWPHGGQHDAGDGRVAVHKGFLQNNGLHERTSCTSQHRHRSGARIRPGNSTAFLLPPGLGFRGFPDMSNPVKTTFSEKASPAVKVGLPGERSSRGGQRKECCNVHCLEPLPETLPPQQGPGSRAGSPEWAPSPPPSSFEHVKLQSVNALGEKRLQRLQLLRLAAGPGRNERGWCMHGLVSHFKLQSQASEIRSWALLHLKLRLPEEGPRRGPLGPAEGQ